MSYLLISIIVLIVSASPLFIHYKRKKIKAREIVLIAMMSAISVVANLVCAYTLPLHAGTTIVILSGISLGPEAGFLIGAMSRFISNFFMGQGMWTPWQMAASGILGALGGIIFSKVNVIGYFDDKREINKKRANIGLKTCILPVVIMIFTELVGYISFIFTRQKGEIFWGWRLYFFGILGIIIYCLINRHKIPTNIVTVTVFIFITVFVIYGGIMNFATMMTSSSYMGGSTYVSLETLKLLYISGVPYDLMHAGGAAVCGFLMCDGITQKLERIKIKYGMY